MLHATLSSERQVVVLGVYAFREVRARHLGQHLLASTLVATPGLVHEDLMLEASDSLPRSPAVSCRAPLWTMQLTHLRFPRPCIKTWRAGFRGDSRLKPPSKT